MKQYSLEAEAAVEFDVESAFEWYEAEDRVSDWIISNSFAPFIGESSKIRLDTKSYVTVSVAL